MNTTPRSTALRTKGAVGRQVAFAMLRSSSREYSKQCSLLQFQMTRLCGGYIIAAFTTFSPSRSVIDDWDGLGSHSLIRPGTMYESLQDQHCMSRSLQ